MARQVARRVREADSHAKLTDLTRMTSVESDICLNCGRWTSLPINEPAYYALALHKKVVPSGSVGDALRTLIDLHVLTKPSGTRGHYAFDDPMFREWFSKAMSL